MYCTVPALLTALFIIWQKGGAGMSSIHDHTDHTYDTSACCPKVGESKNKIDAAILRPLSTMLSPLAEKIFADWKYPVLGVN
jgi:hypothetical protein